MRHAKKRFRLERFSAWHKATLRSLARALLIQESIRTTKTKAKIAQGYIEKLITKGIRATLSAKRAVYRELGDHKLVNRLFNDIAPRFKSQKGGYTRIISLGHRLGDNAEEVIFELTQRIVKAKPKKVAKKQPIEEAPEEKKEIIKTTEKPREEKPKEEKLKPSLPREKKKIHKVEKSKKFFGGLGKFFKRDMDS